MSDTGSKACALLPGMAVLLAACGGGSVPSAPTMAPTPQPTPQALTVQSGATGAVVAGARVIVDGQELTTDANGRLSVPGGLPGSTLVDILAPGFLERQTLLSPVGGGAAYTLWPRVSASGLDEQFTGQLLYTSSTVGVSDPPFAGESLRRWPMAQSRVEVVYQGPATNPGFREFGPGALAAQAEAVSAINDAAGGRLVFQAPVALDGVTDANRIVLRIFPEYQVCVENDVAAVATLGGPIIHDVTITYCEPRYASNVAIATHELGHAFGLRHSTDPRDIMAPGRKSTLVPSPRERLLMTLMLQRPPGNMFPDNDRSASVSTRERVEFRCP